jgi:hypothetical protein
MRRLFSYGRNHGVLSFITLALSIHFVTVGAQQGGLNTSVLPGLPSNPGDPMAPFQSDMWEQRQLEPDILVSTRNHEHLLTFYNDYRGVQDPNDLGAAGLFSSRGLKRFMERMLAWVTGNKSEKRALPSAAAAAEARVGYSRSYDGGLTWHGGLLGKIEGLDGMTDPKTFAAPCGVGYAVFIAFTRFAGSKVIVLRVQDTNDKDGGDTWVSQGYSILESANNAQNGIFQDLPDIVVDPVRTATGDPCAHRVYVGWATFTGADGAGKLSFARTTAGDGPTWNPTWQKQVIKTGPTLTNQGVMLAVDPRPGTPNTTTGGGTLYYGWRAFATSQNPAGIWLTSSKDFGANFNKNPILVNKTPLQFYDQPGVGRDTTPVTDYWAFRSNALPTMQVVPRTGGATIFIGWQERVTFQGCPVSGAIRLPSTCGLPAANGDPRIVITRSFDGGATWSDWLGMANQRRAVDFGDRDVDASGQPAPPPPGFGYLPRYTDEERKSRGQLMPHLTYGGGRLGLFYYEARGSLTAVPGTTGLLSGMDRQLDARFALLNPVTGGLAGTTQVSRYPIKFGATFANGEETVADIAEVAPGVPKVSKRVNAPNSGNGLKPFIGDYITSTPIVQYVFDRASGLWRWAINPEDVPFAGFRTVFTDSRNVIPAVNNEYQNFVPVGAPGNLPPGCTNQGSRNHDVLHAFVDARVAVNAIATFKQLSGSVDRGFPITVTNGTNTNAAGQLGNRFFRLSFDKPEIASFDQFDPGMDVFDVELLPFSSSTRVVYVTAQNPSESVKVFVVETTGLPATPGGAVTLVANGLRGSVTLNLDPTNDTDPGNPNGTVNEDHTPLVSNPLVSNYTPATPLVSNTALNPLVSNPLVSNNALNPLVSNPLVSNGSLEGETVYQITDTTWKVGSSSNVASAVSAAVNVANAQSLEGTFVFQLLIHKTSTSAGSVDCTAGNVVQDQIISSIPNPLVSNPLVSNPLVSNQAMNPLVSNATFALAPPAEGGPARARAQMRVSNSLAAPAVPPQDETQSDFTSDAVFVTLRAYQIVATVPPNVVYNPLTSPAIAVSPQSVDVVNNQEQGDEPPPPGLSFVVTNTNDGGAGSLRQAILNANSTVGVDNITFDIPGAGPHTITPATALPTVTDPVLIDATTQPGFAGSPVIVLNGAGAGTGVNGLTITGGFSAVRGLVIRNFTGNGILVSGGGDNLIERNHIGTDVTGAVVQGNGANGVQVIDSPNNTIGGATPAARNLIAGNVGEEVRLDGAATTRNMIRGNYIGTNAAGTAVLSSSNSGVYIRKAPGNFVIGNVVSGNTGFAGIAICGDPTTCGGGPAGTQTSDATGNIVQGNFVGTDATGAAPLGNSGYGVSIDSTPNALIGGDTPGAGNVIAFNGLTTFQPGVVVFGPGATGNRILRNSIHSNGGLGIDLAPGGVTPNDGNDGPTVPPYDQDAGVNGLQNFPVLTSAVISGGATTVTGILRTTASTDVVIDLYYNTVCDPSGYGEGQTWFGSISGLTTDAVGNLPFSASIAPALPAGVLVTATATTSEGTSEFSGCRMALAPGFVDWPVFEGGNGHVYEYVTTPGTWTSANAAARARSFRGVAGHLASIASFDENAIVNSLKGGGDMRGWIGLSDAATEGTYQWVTGEPFGYSNWAPNEPNAALNEDFVEMFASAQWNDTTDGEALNQGFLVEYPVDPTALVDSPLTPDQSSNGGDFIDRGFYLPSYPGRLLSRVRLWLSTDTAGTYTISLTARAGTYGGPVIGTTTATVFLPAGRGLKTPVNFDFAPAAVTAGTTVTFAMTQVSPAGLDLYYDVGVCDGPCATPSPFIETEGTTPPLDTLRRNGVSALIFDTLPPPPILF